MIKPTIPLLLILFLSGCATPKPYFEPRITERIDKVHQRAIKEDWLWSRWTKEVMAEVEEGLNEWAEHNLKRR